MKRTTKNQWNAALFSAGGIVIVGILLIAANMIADELNVRADLTEENLYTLSDGTREILQSLDTPVDLRFYYSKSVAAMPVHLKNYARRVEDLLKEYRRTSGGRVHIKKFDPVPDSQEEDSAQYDNMQARTVGGTGQRIYLGIAVSCLDETASLAYLDPQRESQLEYDLTRAIYRVTHPEKPTVGLISSLPVSGAPQNPMMQQKQPQQRPWVIIQELEKQFDVAELTDPTKIPEDVDVLLLIHPKELSDEAYYAIDQYVLGGGRLLAFLDPLSVVDMQTSQQRGFSQPQGSDLGPLLGAWGLEFDTDSVVIDRVYKSDLPGRDGQMQEFLPFLDLGPKTVSEDSPAVAELERLLIPFAGHFSGSGIESADRTVLIHTSEKSGTVPGFMAQMPTGDRLADNIENEGGEKTLAVQLSGTFETAFPDGNPAETDRGGAGEETAEDAGGGAASDSLKQSAEKTTVVLVGDADMLYDNFCVERRRTLFGEVSTPVSDNLALAQNLTEILSGASELIGIRSRGALQRPFEVIQTKKAQAQAKYEDTIADLETELAEAEARLRKLQQGKSEDQKYILSPEQEKEIQRFKKKRAEINKELTEVRRSLRKDIEALENRLTWLNIAAMPTVIVIVGLGFSLHRKRRMARQ